MVDPVQSIRIATNLAQRFRAVITSASSAIGDVGVGRLELAIGEAQQIYPEIWRHLDDARKVLVERGRDVSKFDRLRGDELVHLGVTDVDSRTEINYVALIAGRLRYQTVKTATFNVEGAQRVTAACQCLMDAMPEVDWVALARAEDQEIAAAGSLQAGKWLGIVKWVAIAGVLTGAGVGIYALFTRGGDPDKLKEQAQEHADRALVDEYQERRAHIRTARHAYEWSCDAKARAELVDLLRRDSQLAEARRIESGPCTPQPPSCNDGIDSAELRLVKALDLVQDDNWVRHCKGGIFGKTGDQPVRGLAVAFSAPSAKGGGTHFYRGVSEQWGHEDVVAFAQVPDEIDYISTADLDGDGVDEVIQATTRGLTISRVRAGAFVDIAGPAVAIGEDTGATCTGAIDAPDRKHHAIWVTVFDSAHGKGCPKPGRHGYRLDGDRLVEDVTASQPETAAPASAP